MVKKILLTIASILLVLASATGTVFVLQTVEPQRVDPATPAPLKDTAAQSTTSGTAEQYFPSVTALTSARDTSTKDTLAAISTNLTAYMANNSGELPGTQAAVDAFTTDYLKSVNLQHPVTKVPYSLVINQTPATTESISYQPGFKCGESNSTPTSGSQQQYALSVLLPSGTFYCTGM